jgi:hypothetical protein
MTTKTDFTPEEWLRLTVAPSLAASSVVMASPSGPIGMFKEMEATAKQLQSAREQYASNELVAAVLSEWENMAKTREMPDLQTPKFASGEEAKAWWAEQMQQLAALLAAKATAEEAAGYKAFVYDAAVAAAEAGKDGGFLGIGGVRVTPEEQGALGALKAALDL